MTLLVSCLCPTYNRRPLIAGAIACFQAQTYANRELVILDDGEDPVRDLAEGADARIRYFYELPRRVLGPKRNRCAELARGEIFVLWDDDDWHGPERITRQVADLEKYEMSFLRDITVEDEHGAIWEPLYSAYDFPATAAFRRSVWEQSPWPDCDRGADRRMITACFRYMSHVIPGRDLYRVKRHGNHRTTLDLAPWRWRQT
jgi:glycosyltransferase involved in cell wall biosynthesis